ncbi:uncharacterized protein LOC105633248 isoform X2 [Jatropha curcas]|uniref:uncharacterized protein LOC105633248 isoform X2 n=1 Tax=Jatropha curcas TaxID=180498 RepID=UPI0009D6A47E|nr:uncharacterized protein LOC105633248 isoform X2 [Jatropha curcas]
MARIEAFVCVMVVGMDVVAGILGIEAEIARNKMIIHTNRKNFRCRESGDGLRFGVAAAALLAVAHLTANLHGGFMCICCMEELERLPNINRRQWIVAAIAFPMLVTGTLEISKSRESCTALHSHLLFIGGIFCFVHGLFCFLLCISATISFGNGRTN